MSKDMLGSVVRAAVGVPQDSLDVLAKVASKLNEGVAANVAWRDYLKNLLDNGLPSDVKTAKKLLKFIRTVSLPDIPKFVVAEKLREGETIDGIRVVWIGPNVKANFLEKVEPAVPALDLGEYELVTRSRDPALITERGGEEKVETTFGQFWEFLKANQSGWHVRHIRDTKGVLWAVSGDWRDDGLFVEADSLDYPDDWSVGHRFLSR